MEGTEVRKVAELEDRNWWYAERRHLLARALRGVAPGRAVDVGAAGGGNTRVLRQLGWDAAALEYGADGAEVARERGLPVVRADATFLPLADQSLDLVVAFDVLEHLVEDGRCAAEVHRVLRPGGRFQVAVPCDPALWSAHDDAVDHVRRYTRRTLTDVLEGNGFTVEAMSSWMVLLRPVVWLRRRRSSGSDLTELPWLVNAGLRSIVVLERYLPVRGLPGVTLLVTARR
ncbi:MAG TPA: class I SAM-dependent methyltransferase [Dermatophilaceae bacterium]|nr:class I SAM-dependent methyltransferase [Dermatophilaceae bacterium]